MITIVITTMLSATGRFSKFWLLQMMNFPDYDYTYRYNYDFDFDYDSNYDSNYDSMYMQKFEYMMNFENN